MEFTRYTLRNGIRCIHKQVRSAAVHCALTVGTGSRDEQPAEHGMAHLLEHAFFKGTERRRAYHINCRLENLGGELNAYTTKEETVIHTTTLRADLSKAAELIADIVFHSTFPAKELEKEKDIIVDEINSYKDSPSERIFDDFEDLVFKGSPLGHNILGSKASLMKYTRDDLKRFVARTYNTDQMVFSVIGNVSPKRFREICDRYFASQTASARTFSRERTAPYEPFSKTLHRNCHQAHCLLGGRAYSLRDDRRVALSLLSNLLGGPSANSLLNLAVRERNGLSYSIESSFTPLSDTGIATIYFGTDKDRTDECLSIVRHELERICRGELKERQLGIAKKQYIGQITLAMESNESYPQLPDLRQRGRSGRAACQNPLDHRRADRRGGRGDIPRAESVDAAVQMTMNDLERYIEAHIAPEDELLRELDRETHLSVVQPRMLSGHMQGRLLEMLVRMLAPKRILEIGTFTGYSAICMARGLPVGGELHTIEVDDELEAIAARYFARSGLGDRIFAHIGSALDLAPALGLFDLIFIDGDKREYPDYYRMAMRTLVRSGSYLLADNILWYGKVTEPAAHNDRHTKAIQEFNDLVAADDRVENVILPIRDGLNLIRVK